eukprot:3937601-Rhodomonas_salina.1
MQRIRSFRYGVSWTGGASANPTADDCIFMLWIDGLPRSLLDHLPTALGRTQMHSYLTARLAWLKDWWKKQDSSDNGIQYLTFSFVQGQLDETRPMGLGFTSSPKRERMKDLISGLAREEPVRLAKNFGYETNDELSFDESEVTKKQFLSLDSNHPAKTQITQTGKGGKGQKSEDSAKKSVKWRNNKGKDGSHPSSNSSSRETTPGPQPQKKAAPKTPTEEAGATPSASPHDAFSMFASAL